VRPARRARRHEPAADAHRPADLARDPLGRVRAVAGGARARAGDGYRRHSALVPRDRRRLRARGRRRRRLADRSRSSEPAAVGAAGRPDRGPVVTAVAEPGTGAQVASRLLAVLAGSDLGAHESAYGPLPRLSHGELVDAVEVAGLRGRGGAAFPTHRKLRAVMGGPRPVVVANGAEGEPASTKDRVLLSHAPHLVLDGVQLVAAAVGARRAYVYLPPQPAVVDVVRRALAVRRD